MSGFFNPVITKPSPAGIIKPKCGACGLYKECTTPKMPVGGMGESGVMFVSESPGTIEDMTGRHFESDNGKYVIRICRELGIDLMKECWVTNALICKPPKGFKVKKEHVDYCRPNLDALMTRLRPKSVILMGTNPVQSLLGPLTKQGIGSVNRWTGAEIPLRDWNCWACPTLNPAYVLWLRDESNRMHKPAELWFRRHIQRAFELASSGVPYPDGQPDYDSKVRVLYKPEEIIAALHAMQEKGKPVAFDYETNRLKPDHPESKIISCSFSDIDLDTVAFPMLPQVFDAVRAILTSDCPKIGANFKFEERWTRRILGVRVNKWKHDVVLGAQHLDSRTGTKSVKFQALMRLGVGDWSYKVDQFFKDTDARGFNKIHLIDLANLLHYNGLDSLYEMLIWFSQMKDAGVVVT